MNDDELRAQLERRSNAAPFRAEELLPGINRAIGVRAARPARFARWAPLAGLAAAAAIVLAIIIALPRSSAVGPSGDSSPSPVATLPPDVPVNGTDSSGDFTLTISSPHSVYSTTEAIDVQASLAQAPGGKVTILGGSGSGLVGFGIKQLDGDLAIEPVWTADCTGHPISPSHPVTTAFQKSGSVDPAGPNATMLHGYFSDPQLHLPPGRWQIFADAMFSESPDCSGRNVELRASIEIDVVSSDVPMPSRQPSEPEAVPKLVDCGLVSNVSFDPSPVFLVDGAGAVRSCAAAPRHDEWTVGPGVVLVENIGGSADRIEVAWLSEQCSPERVLIELEPAGAGYSIRVILDRSGPDGYQCTGDPRPVHAIVALDQPIDWAQFTAQLVTEPDPNSEVPQTVECQPADSSHATGRVPTIVDHTGVVAGCSQLDAGTPAAGGVAVTNMNGFDSVRFDWLDITCDGPVEADFKGAVGGYKLAVQQQSQTCPPGVPVAIAVDYRIPMPAELITAEIQEPPPVVACADMPNVTVVDEVGVVGSCAASESTASPGTDLLFDNPGGDTSALQLSWAASSTCTYEVHLQPRDPYSIAIYNVSETCPSAADDVDTVTLQLTTPIAADQITGWSIGGPPSTPPPPGTIECGALIKLTDTSGYVASCTDEGAKDEHSQDPKVSMVDGDPSRLFVWWIANTCVDHFDVGVSGPTSDSTLTVSVSGTMESNCVAGPEGHGIDVAFDQPIDPATVKLALGEWTRPGIAQTPSPGPRNLICSDTMAAEDATGDLVSCQDDGAFAYPSPTDPNVTNPSDDPTTIHIWWDSTSCVTSRGRTDLSVSREPNGDYAVVITQTAEDGCLGVGINNAVDLHFDVPVDASTVTVTPIYSSVSPSPAPTATPAADVLHFAGHGFGFDYPASWSVLSQLLDVGYRGPLYGAVGIGSINWDCSVNADVTVCADVPSWNVPSDGIVVAYYGDGLPSGPPQQASPPSPSLGPGEEFVNVGGRQAIFWQTPYDSMKWRFTDNGDMIDVHWGKDYAQPAEGIAWQIIGSWEFDPGYQP